MIKVNIKKLDEDAVIPKYAKEGDAGLDLTAVSMEETELYYEYGTGIAVEIPRGYVGLLFPRSSVTNKDLILKNSVGIIDSSYRGEIKLRFLKTSTFADIYEEEERVGQLLIMPYPEVEFNEVEELNETERSSDGFGSTGM